MSDVRPPDLQAIATVAADSSRVAPAATASQAQLMHLRRLEVECIHVMREVVAECERPVMLHSIGKDSAVLLHLAKGLLPREGAASAAARRQDLEGRSYP